MKEIGLIFVSLSCFCSANFATDERRIYGDDEIYDEYVDTYELPKFLATPQSFSVEIGDDITLPCDVDKSDESYPLMFKYISLRRSDRMIYVGSKALGKNPRIRKEGNSFVLSDVRKSDAGKYVCRFESRPVVQLIHTLNVQYPALIERVSDEVQKVTQGTRANLQCRARGNPTPAITWSKKDGHLPSGAKSEEGSSIALGKVDRHVEGTYICTASNGIGEPSSTSVTVQVEYKPEIFTEQKIINSVNGYEAILVCKVHARPSSKVMWLRGNSLVSSDKHIMTHDGALRHTLTIKKVSEEDFGDYTCRARNRYGETLSDIVLTGLPKAPKITSSPNGGEKMSYTLTWKTETFAPITQYRVKYRRIANSYSKRPTGNWIDNLHSPLKTSMSSRETRFTHGGILEMRHLLLHLEPAEDYEVEVRVENKFGWSSFSRNFKFFTKKAYTGSLLDYFSGLTVGGPSMNASPGVNGLHLGLLALTAVLFL